MIQGLPSLSLSKLKPVSYTHLDALAQVTQLLSTVPGRRTILLVSSGVDQKSGIKFAALKQFADDKSVAIFGLRDLTHFTADHGITKPCLLYTSRCV